MQRCLLTTQRQHQLPKPPHLPPVTHHTMVGKPSVLRAGAAQGVVCACEGVGVSWRAGAVGKHNTLADHPHYNHHPPTVPP
jgi:hypothetical protein